MALKLLVPRVASVLVESLLNVFAALGRDLFLEHSLFLPLYHGWFGTYTSLQRKI